MSGVPIIPGESEDRTRWYRTYDWHEGRRIPTGDWPKIELICTSWEENAAGERRLVERRRVWVDFGKETAGEAE